MKNEKVKLEMLDITGEIDYTKLRAYAATCCRQRGVGADAADDIAHDAWIDCQRRARSVRVTGDRFALARRIMFTSIQDAIDRYRNWSGHDAAFDDSDHLTAAERTYLAADDWQDPFWLRLFQLETKKLERDVRRGIVTRHAPRAVKQLLKDSRLPVARQALRVSRPTFGTILRILRERFALCFLAHRAFRSFRETLRFPSDNRLCK